MSTVMGTEDESSDESTVMGTVMSGGLVGELNKVKPIGLAMQ
jgi:hypothetical protein